VIINGDARTGRASYINYLAWHLQRTDNNERVTVREISGTASNDVLGALKEIAAYGAGAVSTRPIYHANIDPDPTQPDLTEPQKVMAIDRLGEELGLTGQPRIVLEHIKNGRSHLHVVWSRIDVQRMTAIHDGLNYRRHEIVARQLEIVFGHDPVPGPLVGRLDAPRPNRAPSNAEMRQAERTGVGPAELTGFITAVWQQTDSGRSLAAALTGIGVILARGDRRDFVIVDPGTEVHSLRRRVQGARTADIRERMSDVDPGTLPTVAEAKVMQRERWNVLFSEKHNRDALDGGYLGEMHSPSPDPLPAAEILPSPPVTIGTLPEASDVEWGQDPKTKAPAAIKADRGPLPPGWSVQLGVGPAPPKARSAVPKLRRKSPAIEQPGTMPPGTSIPLGVGPEPPPNIQSEPPSLPPPGWSVPLGVGPEPPSRGARGGGRGRGKRGPHR
jgi:hypothetical protein